MTLLQSLLFGIVASTQCSAYTIPRTTNNELIRDNATSTDIQRSTHNEFMRDDTTSTDVTISLCALTCISVHTPEFGCDILDIACQCASEPLYDTLTNCALQNCTIDEAFAFAKFGQMQCNRPTDHYHHHTLLIMWSMLSALYVSYILRMISRLLVTKMFWWDDLFHSIATVFCIPMTVSIYKLERLGIGYHIFQLDAESLPKLWFWYFMLQAFWMISIMFLKTSVILLYLRIFPGREVRIACYCVLGCSMVGAMGIILVDIFQCRPISAAWTLQHNGATCLDSSSLALASAYFNMITEIAIFVLPMRSLMALRLKLGKKIRVMGLFGIGVIIIIISGLRIKTLSSLGSYTDSTYKNYPAWLWVTIEITAAHACLAVPGIVAMLNSMYQKVDILMSKSVSSGHGSSESESSQAHSKTRSISSKPRIKLDSLEGHYGDEVELQQVHRSTENGA